MSCNVKKKKKNETKQTKKKKTNKKHKKMVPLGLCDQRRFRSACTFAQSYQNIYCVHYR